MMRKLVFMGLACLLFALPGAAAAKPHPKTPKPGKGRANPRAGQCGTVQKGFVVDGTFVSATPTTLNADGTYSGDLALNVTGTNAHARRSGVLPGNRTYSGLVSVATTLGGVADNPQAPDGKVDFADVTPADSVHLTGKVAYRKRGSRKRPCSGGGTYGAVRIDHIVVTRSAY